MNDNFLAELMEQVKKADLRKKRKAILVGIHEKWVNHDFIGETPDDRWVDVFVLLAGYLTREEAVALEATEDEGEDTDAACVSGVRVIQRAFVIWLAKSYGVTAEDLEDG